MMGKDFTRALLLGSKAVKPTQMALAQASRRTATTVAAAKQRPLSPHLTIWRFRENMITSVLFRGTAIFMTGGMFGLGAIALAAPQNYKYYVYQLQQYPALNAIFKFGVAFPLSYHLFGGLRHLAWDNIMWQSIKANTQTGYAAIAAASVVSIAAMFSEADEE